MSHLHDDPLYQRALDELCDRCEEEPHVLFPYIENNVNDLAIAALVMCDAPRESEVFQFADDMVSNIRRRAVREYQDKHVADMIDELRQEEADAETDARIDAMQA